MGKDLLIARPDDTLQAVARLMHGRRVGSALIVDDGNLAGILTERDVIRAIANGEHLDSSTAADYMSRLLTTVPADQDIGVAAELMSRQRIRHLPVLEEGRIVGMLSLRDIVRWSLAELGYEESHHLVQLADLSA
jgi:CBS domain-containing protein